MTPGLTYLLVWQDRNRPFMSPRIVLQKYIFIWKLFAKILEQPRCCCNTFVLVCLFIFVCHSSLNDRMDRIRNLAPGLIRTIIVIAYRDTNDANTSGIFPQTIKLFRCLCTTQHLPVSGGLVPEYFHQQSNYSFMFAQPDVCRCG